MTGREDRPISAETSWPDVAQIVSEEIRARYPRNTRKEAARDLDTNLTTIRNYQTGETAPSARMLQRMSIAWGPAFVLRIFPWLLPRPYKDRIDEFRKHAEELREYEEWLIGLALERSGRDEFSGKQMDFRFSKVRAP